MLFGLLIAADQAFALKFDIQAKNLNYKYGSSGYVLVNSNPSVIDQKVTGLVTFRTDWASVAEIGHYWATAGPTAFYVYTDTFGLNTIRLSSVTPGSTQRYHTGYAYGNGLQYYWMNDEIVGTEWSYPPLTSQWPGVNVERDTYSVMAGDNVGCFTGLKFKNYEWGSWSSWTGVAPENDTDQIYKRSVVSPTHVDFVYGY